jgi:hypothetical protein
MTSKNIISETVSKVSVKFGSINGDPTSPAPVSPEESFLNSGIHSRVISAGGMSR